MGCSKVFSKHEHYHLASFMHRVQIVWGEGGEGADSSNSSMLVSISSSHVYTTDGLLDPILDGSIRR